MDKDPSQDLKTPPKNQTLAVHVLYSVLLQWEGRQRQGMSWCIHQKTKDPDANTWKMRLNSQSLTSMQTCTQICTHICVCVYVSYARTYTKIMHIYTAKAIIYKFQKGTQADNSHGQALVLCQTRTWLQFVLTWTSSFPISTHGPCHDLVTDTDNGALVWVKSASLGPSSGETG